MDFWDVSTFWLLWRVCCYEHAWTHIILITCFQFWGFIPRNKIAGSYGTSMFNFFEELSSCSLKQLHHLRFLPILSNEQGPSFSMFLPMLVIFQCFEYGHPSECRVTRQILEVMAPHSSTLAWKTPWTEEPGGLQSRGHKDLDTSELACMMINFLIIYFNRVKILHFIFWKEKQCKEEKPRLLFFIHSNKTWVLNNLKLEIA